MSIETKDLREEIGFLIANATWKHANLWTREEWATAVADLKARPETAAVNRGISQPLEAADAILASSLFPFLLDKGWEPIETAPQNMTEIIGMDAKGDVHRTWYFAPSSRTKGWLRKGGKWWTPVMWTAAPKPFPLKEST